MPKAKLKQAGLLDSWGRRNRKLIDKNCAACGVQFKPIRESSRYCSRPCAWSKNGGHNKKAESWWTNSKGYIEGQIWLPDGTQIRVKQHRFIVEGILGRPLKPTEDVHHRDGNRSNNHPSNLELMDHSKHTTLTNSNRAYKKGYSMRLSDSERRARSLRAIQMQLGKLGRAAIARAKGENKP